MDERQTKMRAADTMLEMGVRVQCVTAPLLFRLFGRRKLNITLRQPTLADLIRISRIVVGMGLDPAALEGLTLAGSYKLVQAHACEALRVLAVSSAPRWVPRRLYAWWLGRHLTPSAFAQAWMVFTLTAGVADFTGSIRLMLTADNLSPTDTENQQAE